MTDETSDYDIILKCNIKFYYLEFNYDIVCSNYCMTAFRQHRFFFAIYQTVARTCSLIFIVLDVLKPLGHKRLIEYELEGFGIR